MQKPSGRFDGEDGGPENKESSGIWNGGSHRAFRMEDHTEPLEELQEESERDKRMNELRWNCDGAMMTPEKELSGGGS